MFDKYLLGGAVGLAVLMGAYFSGKAEGVKETNAAIEAAQDEFEEKAIENARKEFESRERSHDKVTEKTNTVLRESKIYYETNPNPVCLDESSSVRVSEARKRIAASAGSEIAGESNSTPRRAEETLDSDGDGGNPQF